MKKLRKVIDLTDKFLEKDHNDHVDNWNEQINICRGWTIFYPEIESIFNQLESLVSSMRYVKYGDYYYADDHNLFVRSWKKLIEIDRVVVSYPPEFSKLEKIVGQMSEIKPGDFYLAMHHNLFAEAWELQDKLNAEAPKGDVIILPRHDWDGMLDYAVDNAVVFVEVDIGTAAPTDVLDLLNSKKVKLIITVDTEPYHNSAVPAFKDIMFKVDKLTSTSAPNYFTIYQSHDAKHFESSTVPGLYDYLIDKDDHAPDVTRWTSGTDYYAYKYVGKGVLVEVPRDGCWKTVNILDKYILWKPCSYPEYWTVSRVILITVTTTDMPSAHEYPTFDETLKVWAEQRGWKFYDLR